MKKSNIQQHVHGMYILNEHFIRNTFFHNHLLMRLSNQSIVAAVQFIKSLRHG